MKKNTYCAIIGDINKSRTLPSRSQIQKKFQRAIDKINEEFSDVIASRFLITIGDEFQGLLKSPSDSYALIKKFNQHMSPVSFSFGVGIGTLSTPLKKETLGMDGTVFYNARTAIESAKKEKRSIVFRYEHPSESILNELISLMDIYWKRLTPRQQQVVTLYNNLQNQQLVAKKLKITQPAVHKTLNAAGANRYLEAEKSITRFLDVLGKQSI